MKKHLGRKMPCPPIFEDVEPDAVCQSMFKRIVKTAKCKHCDKMFSSLSGRSMHMKRCHHDDEPGGCQQVADSSMVTTIIADLNTIKTQMSSLLEKQATNSSTTINSNNNTNNNNTHTNITQNTQNNVIINAFGKETLQHITPAFLDRCVRRTDKGLVELIEKIHFDPDVKQNNNIRATNARAPLVKIHDGQAWKYGRKDRVLDRLVDTGHEIMQDHLEDNEDRIKDQVCETMFDHVRKWMDKVQEKDKRTLDDLFLDVYLMILNATAVPC
jgi:hypothetical protein